MNDPKNLLRDLHTLHLRVKDLRGETEDGPRKLRKYQAKIDHQQKQLHDLHETIKHLKVTIHEKEVSIKDNLAKIAKHQQQMNEATSKKEYDALRTEIDHERQANRTIEDQILEVMGDLEEKTKVLPELEKTLQQAKNDFRQEEERIAGTHSSLEARLKEALAALQALEADLPSDLRTSYQRLVQARKEDALAAVQGKTCAGCYTAITPQNHQDLRSGRFIACKSCGRLLYLAE